MNMFLPLAQTAEEEQEDISHPRLLVCGWGNSAALVPCRKALSKLETHREGHRFGVTREPLCGVELHLFGGAEVAVLDAPVLERVVENTLRELDVFLAVLFDLFDLALPPPFEGLGAIAYLFLSECCLCDGVELQAPSETPVDFL